MNEFCKTMVFDGGGFHRHRCQRKAVADGYCRQHHPESVEKRRRAAIARYEEQMANSIEGRVIRLQAEVNAWRERFPQYIYRPQDDCIELKQGPLSGDGDSA